ncbi:MAG: PAS domain S-box protein [Gammaproteobacteria bacterium]
MTSPACIVVVDDNAAALKATARLLERAGYRVHAAETGQRGLELIREHTPQLVLLDVMLPDIGGPEVLAQIKSDPRLQSSSVVFLSATRTASVHQAGGLDAGAEGYMTRPIANEELLARVRLHLRQRELTERLREQELRFRSLVGGLPDAILVVSPEGEVRYANPSAEALFQRPSEELQTLPFGIPIAALEAGEPQIIELSRSESSQVIAELRVSELWWQNKPAWIVALHDITEQRATRDALHASEQRYRGMVEHLPDIVYVNRNEQITYINPAGVKLLRAESEADILGHSPFEFIHPDIHDMVRERIARARREPMVSPVTENTLVALDGTHIPVDVTAISYRSGEHMDIQVIARDITLRKQAEAERRELLARERAARQVADEASHYYRALFESAPGCYLVLTPGIYEIVAVSEAYLRATNTTREQLAGQELFEVFPDDPARPDPGAAARLRTSLERVTRDKRADVMGVECFPIPQPESQGGGFEERFWSITHAPVMAPDGKVAFIIHRVEDVTEYLLALPDQASGRQFLASRTEMMEADIVLRSRELDEARRKLEESQALLSMASELSQLGAWSIELPDYTVTWTDKVYQIHELAVGTAITVERAIDWYVGEDREAIRTAFHACVERGVPYDLELQILTGSGRLVWVRTMGEAVRDEQGNIAKLQGTLQDISYRKEAEARALALEEKLTAMLERIGEGFMALDAEHRITYINREVERMIGQPREELLGRSLREAFTLAAGSDFEKQYDRVIRDATPVMFEAYYEPIKAWVEVRAYPSDEGVAIYCRDVTRERKLEEKVQHSQRLEAVGQLTGGVAHDFNNLLTVILGNAELLGEKLGADSSLGSLAVMISKSAQRGARLTNALLSFARRQALDPVAVDVNEVVRGMHDMLRRTLAEDIDIEFQLDEGLHSAMIDPAQLENAILNLCLNARDAMPRGGRLTIETGMQALHTEHVDQRLGVSPGEYVLVAVSDTGSGIPTENLPRVFEPFYTTKEKSKGTGLGLAMVYGFVRQSGGQVNVYSEVGEGTTVKMYLPLADHAAAPRAEVPALESPRGSEKILLVEDDDMVRMYAEELLASLGYDVITTSNGPEAIAILEQGGAVDLLFTDIVMPGGMNGRELAERARVLRPGLKVLYTSGYTENAIIHHGRLDAGVDLLSKPYRRAELATRIRAALDRTSSGEAPQ